MNSAGEALVGRATRTTVVLAAFVPILSSGTSNPLVRKSDSAQTFRRRSAWTAALCAPFAGAELGAAQLPEQRLATVFELLAKARALPVQRRREDDDEISDVEYGEVEE
jgi:hypothetical protein